MEVISYAEKLRRMKNWKYFCVFVLFVTFLVLCMGMEYSGHTSFTGWRSDEWMQEQRRRLQAIDEVCQQQLGPKPLTHQLFVFIPQYNLLYCMIPKAGTTTWMGGIFPKLSKMDSNKIKENFIETRKEFQAQFIVNNMGELNRILKSDVFSFTNVRHPFERLVSAYDEFIIEHLLERQSFQSFVTNVVLGEAKASPDDGMFSKMDLHWRPYNSLCFFCNVSYNVISKSETFGEDKSKILEMLGEKEEEEEEILNLHHGGDSTADKTRKYLKNITQELKTKLTELYKYEFAMFNYDPDLY